MRILLALATIAVAQMACAQTTPFTVSVSAAKSQIVAGDPVDLVVIMTNTSDHDVDCTYSYSNALDRNYLYAVTDQNGQPVRRIEKEHHGGSDVWPCILKPGQSTRTGGGRISVLYDFSRPGKYSIQVSRAVWGAESRPGTIGKGGNHPRLIKSKPIVVTVERNSASARAPE